MCRLCAAVSEPDARSQLAALTSDDQGPQADGDMSESENESLVREHKAKSLQAIASGHEELRGRLGRVPGEAANRNLVYQRLRAVYSILCGLAWS